MNKDIIAGRWKEIKGSIKQQWAKFTEEDVLKLKGSYEELKGELQKKYGHKKEEAEKEINDFVKKHKFDKDDKE
jgi:uncharacterized protein YjbJ (UPF0337 family)